MTQKEIDLANDCLVELMQKEPVKILQWMLVQLGFQMIEANAETMELKQESTLKGKRYRIVSKSKITEIKMPKQTF